MAADDHGSASGINAAVRHNLARSAGCRNQRRRLFFRFVGVVLRDMTPVVAAALALLLFLAFTDTEGLNYLKFLRGSGAFLVAYTIGFSILAIIVFYYHLLKNEPRRLKWTAPSEAFELEDVYQAILAEYRRPSKR